MRLRVPLHPSDFFLFLLTCLDFAAASAHQSRASQLLRPPSRQQRQQVRPAAPPTLVASQLEMESDRGFRDRFADRAVVIYHGRRYTVERAPPPPDPRDYGRTDFWGRRGRGRYLLISSGPKRPRVAASTKDMHRLLREVKAGEGDTPQTECAVCLQDYDDAEETLRAMPCAHAFHQQCIFDWLRRNAVCPLCRHQLLPTHEEQEEEDQSRRRRTSVSVSAADHASVTV